MLLLGHGLRQDQKNWARILQVISSGGQHDDARAGLGLIQRCARTNAPHLVFDVRGMDEQGGEFGLWCVADRFEEHVHPLDSLRLLCPFGRTRVQAAMVQTNQTSTLQFQAHLDPIQPARSYRGIEAA